MLARRLASRGSPLLQLFRGASSAAGKPVTEKEFLVYRSVGFAEHPASSRGRLGEKGRQ